METLESLELTPLSSDLARVETALRVAVASSDRFLAEVATHLIDAGGKRVRPTLTLCAAYAAGSSTEPVPNEAITGAVQKVAPDMVRDFCNPDFTVTRVLARFKETAPTLKDSAAKPRSPVLRVKWKIDNPDADDTTYTLEARRDGEANWRPISTGKAPLTAVTWEWNTETYPDGWYKVRDGITTAAEVMRVTQEF